MRVVEDQRLAAAQRMIEHALEPRQPPFRHPRGNIDALSLLRVVVDIEVFSLQDLEREIPLLDVVASEILLRRARNQHRHGK